MRGVIALLVALAIGYSLGRYLQPPEIRIEEREVTIHHDTVTTIREIVHVDGSKEIVTIIDDKTKEESTTKTETSTMRPQWLVTAGFNPKCVTTGYLYEVSVSRRVLGPIMVGVFANTDKNIGLNVGLEF